jgi:hypothetical protein
VTTIRNETAAEVEAAQTALREGIERARKLVDHARETMAEKPAEPLPEPPALAPQPRPQPQG